MKYLMTVSIVTDAQNEKEAEERLSDLIDIRNMKPNEVISGGEAIVIA